VEAAAVSYFGKDVPVPASAGIRAALRTRNILSGDASGSRRARGPPLFRETRSCTLNRVASCSRRYSRGCARKIRRTDVKLGVSSLGELNPSPSESPRPPSASSRCFFSQMFGDRVTQGRLACWREILSRDRSLFLSLFLSLSLSLSLSRLKRRIGMIEISIESTELIEIN
jgi:hypothetical protein